MDGTALNQNHQLSNLTIKTVEDLQKNDIDVIFATGSMKRVEEEYMKNFDMKYLITNNGEVQEDLQNDEMMKL